MLLEITEQDAELLKLLLMKEFEETRVEIHHARNLDFKMGLEDREVMLRRLMIRFEQPVA